MKDDEFAREFTCNLVVLPSCRLGVRPLGVVAFIVYQHVNSRVNSSSFILAVFGKKTARMKTTSSHVNPRAGRR